MRVEPDENVHRVQRHRDDADDEVGDRLVDDQNDEVGMQLLLVPVRQEDEKVGDGADGGEDKQHRRHGDHRRADVTARCWTGNSSSRSLRELVEAKQVEASSNEYEEEGKNEQNNL